MAYCEHEREVRQVLAAYPTGFATSEIRPVENAGGFSGARLWRVSLPDEEYCLRRWPGEHPSRDRLSWIHGTLLHIGRRGVDFIPVPWANRQGETFVTHAGHFWELARWLPGSAHYHRDPTAAKLTAAMTALARFHLAAADSPLGPSTRQVSPGITDRRHQLRQLVAGGAERLRGAVRGGGWRAGLPLAERLLTLFPLVAPRVAERLENAARFVVPIQPCLRDIWHDHVLFQGEVVTGIVDFGAMRGENVAADVARLLGSLVRDDPSAWQAGLQAYASIRPLSADELSLVPAFDQSTVLLAGMNWLRWIYVEGRQFDPWETVARRLAEILQRLEHLTILEV